MSNRMISKSAERTTAEELLAVKHILSEDPDRVNGNTVQRLVKATRNDLVSTIHTAVQIAIDNTTQSSKALDTRIKLGLNSVRADVQETKSAVSELRSEIAALESVLPERTLKKLSAISERIAAAEGEKVSLSIKSIEASLHADLNSGGTWVGGVKGDLFDLVARK